MLAINKFAEVNYKKGYKPEIVAEYTALYMQYLKIYERMYHAGEDLSIDIQESSLSGDDFDKMIEWETSIIEGIQTSLGINGIPEVN